MTFEDVPDIDDAPQQRAGTSPAFVAHFPDDDTVLAHVPRTKSALNRSVECRQSAISADSNKTPGCRFGSDEVDPEIVDPLVSALLLWLWHMALSLR